MDSQYLQCQQDDTRMEHEAALEKLKEAEEKIKAYEAATQLAYHEVGQMQNELQNEQRCLEKAVRVASRLYSRNTELKRLSMRQRTIAPSQRRQAWKDKRSKDALELTLPASRVKVGEHESETTDTNDVEDLSEDEENDESSDDLDEIVGLDQRSRSDLDNALEKAGSLRKINHEMSTKLSKLEDNEKGYETTVRQLQAVIKMKDEELKALKEKYDVEAQVRQRAETYAARMYGKNKAFQRQSVLMKSGRRDSFEDKLESTMKELERLTAELEEEKMAHKQEVQRLEEELESALSGEKTNELENKIRLLMIEVEQLKAHKEKLENRNAELESQVETRGEPGMSAPPPPPMAPPPPPPPPPPIATMPQGASQSIYELIAERKANKADGDSTGDQMKKKSSTLPTMSGYADAMEEMMRRIKSGNALKKTSTVTPPNATELDDTYASIGDGGSSEESTGESEYDQIYSEVGTLERRPTTVQKAATIGGYASKPKTSDVKPSGMFNFAALRPVKKRNKSDHDTLEDPENSPKNEFQLRKTPFPRDSGFQDSVRLPKDMNPDLKKILDKRRLGMKKMQSETDKP